ncbi:hypothetical protein GQ55_5G098900 [Panicum hallii var. hallii]|uniref:Uncharacterized protein n=1 Tax=Panicum hallii var. hallii TaxID=1504633 RepID=A0A2T7DEQ9_9POAL|nr:hypothetical protein GQ55_5G098900 [Panicum hallii var. hallii]
MNSQLDDQPLRFSLPLILVQVSVILVLSAAAHLVLRRLGQSRFITQMLVGVFLGPTVTANNFAEAADGPASKSIQVAAMPAQRLAPRGTAANRALPHRSCSKG